jgi:uncharacterized protein (DUF2141 family)
MTLSKLLPAIAGFAVFLLSTRSVLAADLIVAVSGLRNQNGQVLIALHDTNASFPNKWSLAVAVKRVAAQDGAGVRFENLVPGRYALIAVHDEDGNGEMTKTFIGLPVEGFGTSNNPSFFGPPRFGAAVFELRDSVSLSVRIVYF